MPKSIDFKTFSAEVYDVVRQIPEGKVATYGLIARLIGYPNHSRFVGRAMSLTPREQGIPAWRVVNAQGRTTPGWAEQRSLLAAEDVGFLPSGRVKPDYIWNPFQEYIEDLS